MKEQQKGQELHEVPFNKYYMCHFSNTKEEEDQSNNDVRRIWIHPNWSTEHIDNILTSWLHRENNKDITEDDARKLIIDCIQLTLVFLQNNFTGPLTQLRTLVDLIEDKRQLLTAYNAFEKLVVNGEEINPNVKIGELFVIAEEMLELLLIEWPESIILKWWHLRHICLHQQILDELTKDLYEDFKNTAEFLLRNCNALQDKELEALLCLEVANGFLFFHRTQKSEEILDDLCKRLNVTLNVEGLLGVRTKFQQKPLPQLCLKVQQTNESAFQPSSVTNDHTKLPQLLLLDDDTRLERIRFLEQTDNEVMSLPSVLQALVLAKVKQLKRSQPKDRLADEELEPYIQTLLYQESGPLQVRQSILLLNCVQESKQRRTVERSWKQCEEAVKLLNESKYTLAERLSYGFAGFLQPIWEVQLQLCELLISLGMIKTALDIYLEIHAWQPVIECYSRLELRHKAAEIITQELEKKPTALLHCLLGDATDDVSCYATAWEFSKHTSGKAQAHWGNYHFERKEFTEAIAHLEKSVEINPLQENIWLRLGYAAIMMERWELAVHAYITYTHLEPLGFEAWNNLAKALVKLGDKKRAHKVLSESLKCNYSNWKVWENFMLVSVDTGNFEDVLNAYNRLNELKERFLDLEVLSITIKAIAQGKLDAKGQSAERLRSKAIKLMGYQCIKHGNEYQVWELSALLAHTPLNKAQKLVKAFRAYTTKEQSWAAKQATSLQALTLCHELCKQSLDAIATHTADESEAMITSQMSSARLSAQACLRTVEKEMEKWEENQHVLNEVKLLLEKLTEVVRQRMSK